MRSRYPIHLFLVIFISTFTFYFFMSGDGGLFEIMEENNNTGNLPEGTLTTNGETDTNINLYYFPRIDKTYYCEVTKKDIFLCYLKDETIELNEEVFVRK